MCPKDVSSVFVSLRVTTLASSVLCDRGEDAEGEACELTNDDFAARRANVLSGFDRIFGISSYDDTGVMLRLLLSLSLPLRT